MINPEYQNLKGQLYKYDEAGLIETPEYDFKGNVDQKRQVIDNAVLKAKLDNYDTFIVDWTGLPPILDSFIFQTDMIYYDALNRIITLPQDLETERKEIIPTYNRAGTLEKGRFIQCYGRNNKLCRKHCHNIKDSVY
ncbi:MAG: hypothetical protein R2779_04275 [Crocinitomicaceae bacterium]